MRLNILEAHNTPKRGPSPITADWYGGPSMVRRHRMLDSERCRTVWTLTLPAVLIRFCSGRLPYSDNAYGPGFDSGLPSSAAITAESRPYGSPKNTTAPFSARAVR